MRRSPRHPRSRFTLRRLGTQLLIAVLAALAGMGATTVWGAFNDSDAVAGGSIATLTLTAPTSPITTRTAACVATTTWTKSLTADGYIVEYQPTAASAWTVASATVGDVSTYTDSAARYGAAVAYRVRSRDIGSGWTSTAYATATAASCAPAVPTGVAATNPGSSDVVTWTASTGATGYEIDARIGTAGAWNQVGVSATTSFKDTTQYTIGAAIYYRVRATNNGAVSANSALSTALTWNNFRVTSIVFSGTMNHKIVVTFSKASTTASVGTVMYFSLKTLSLNSTVDGAGGLGKLTLTNSFGSTGTVSGTVTWSGGNTVMTWQSSGLEGNGGQSAVYAGWTPGTGVTNAADASAVLGTPVPTVSGTF
jgi:hypothetical protein